MNPYTALADYYDILTADVPYDLMAARILELMEPCRPRLAVELGCGTGSISRRLSGHGLELISVDSAPHMLDIARDKCAHLPQPPLFICQDMTRLDLYGTVQAAVSTLDSLNYLPNIAALGRAFAGVSLFLERGGRFIFDVKTPALFAHMAGTASVQEGDGFLCAWQYGYQAATRRGVHRIDLFVKRGGGYRRFSEAHRQRAFSRREIEGQLALAGLRTLAVYADYSEEPARDETGRLLFVAEKP